jgi:hypothetical protein
LPKADGGIPRLTTFVVNILFAPLVNLLLAIRRRHLCGFAAVPQECFDLAFARNEIMSASAARGFS